MTSNKKAGHLKGSTNASAGKDNTWNDECQVEIAEAYVQKINEVKAVGKENEGVIETDLGEFLGEMWNKEWWKLTCR